ncbi:MerR family transcriptional regulator [Streptomyces sp. H10-C2]|uniref:MerR family transcriptional regulator n=1 Tax=unclassified Streptomyces TaxID=2593676 RepID=UPI0024BA3CDE|nr:MULTISPECIES: MerR family transcriptional regulator [unclassified Streptomyces]MDJ0341675.1 MerR family transcriptional regulator [Streptomyces sp. PH10-H1]MDJ0369017.1 MerR family transcriptional regulator [Streptomyces sp. H10-C2]
MRLAQLSERSGVPAATIKYYLREQLMPPGRRITATQAEYGDDHLRRLRLVRALIQVGKMPVATARQVLAAVEDESLDQNMRLGAAVRALPHGPEPDEDDPATVIARQEVGLLMERLGWSECRDVGDSSPAWRTLVAAVAALARLGYPCDAGHLAPYARSAAQLAVADLDLVEEFTTPLEQVEAAVALTVLYEPVLLSLRRLAEAEESNRRFGAGG